MSEHTDEFKQGDIVIAFTAIDGYHPDWVTYYGTDDGDFWHYPLRDEVVEALAQAAHDAYFDEVWEHQSEIERDLWRNVVKAVFDKLRSDAV